MVKPPASHGKINFLCHVRRIKGSVAEVPLPFRE
jgi:hypothetical protein